MVSSMSGLLLKDSVMEQKSTRSSHSNSDVTYDAFTSFKNEVTDYINELIEEDEFNSVAGK